MPNITDLPTTMTLHSYLLRKVFCFLSRHIRFMRVAMIVLVCCLSPRLTAQVKWLTASQHDFGVIVEGTQVAHVFEFRNEGARPLTIETVRTTCGCTVAEYADTPIMSGQTGSIKIHFDGQVQLGNRFKKKIKLYFKERRRAETLVIKGKVSS